MRTRKQTGYGAGNLEFARIILADPVQYAGIQLEWARMVLSKRLAAGPRVSSDQEWLFAERTASDNQTKPPFRRAEPATSITAES